MRIQLPSLSSCESDSSTTTTSTTMFSDDIRYSPLFTPKPKSRYRRCFRMLLLALVIFLAVFTAWWRLVFLRLGESDPVASCDGCHCIKDDNDNDSVCPPRPPTEFSWNLISRLRSQIPIDPIDLDCDPYLDESCEMNPAPDPALLDLGETAICAFRYLDTNKTCSRHHDAQYRMITYPSFEDALDDGAIPTHAGHCGVCSTAQDLAAYLEFFDLRTHGEYCTKQGLLLGSYEDVERCFRETLGFTPACASIWAANGAHTSRECIGSCWYQGIAWNSPDNNLPAPTCELNQCLQCDEDISGPNFMRFAGRTRRRSGLLSAIARPCSSLHPEIEHQVCEGD